MKKERSCYDSFLEFFCYRLPPSLLPLDTVATGVPRAAYLFFLSLIAKKG